MTGKRWYVVQSQPHAERKAAAHLDRQGFQSYLPQFLKSRRHARRIETVTSPLFPSYLFVLVDTTAQRWRSIQSTVGVARLVCNGNMPAPVPEGVVSALKQREDERGFFRLEQRPLFKPGETVSVLHGAFASYLGLFERMTDRERVAILLDLLGRKVRVVLDASSITAM
jgi:transcriptional antiterminator RfaH